VTSTETLQPRTNPFAQADSRTRVYAVASGKGGVGKSSVTANLAVALAQQGLAVGVVDADIYGFSIPRMLGVADKPVRVDDHLEPPASPLVSAGSAGDGTQGGDGTHGGAATTGSLKVMSIGMFVPPGTAVAWRGPKLHRAIEQFLTDVEWGQLDVLLLDLPPGTGDVALSVAQLLPNSELLIVTTPQAAAAEVAERAGSIAAQTNQGVVGVVENMSWLVQADGSRLAVFGSGGGALVADRLTDVMHARVPLLGHIPLDPAVRQGGDDGVPVIIGAPNSPAAQVFRDIAAHLASHKRSLAGQRLSVTPIRH
jgi:ATP-binding protein involved in chromosome partitioning